MFKIILNNEAQAAKMNLSINQAKNKYIPYTKTKFNHSFLKRDKYKFEVVEYFTYIGSEINTKNNISPVICSRTTFAENLLKHPS